MAATPPDIPHGPPWPTEGEALKADPSSLRGYGKNISTIGENLRSDTSGPVMRINGTGEDMLISTGGFAEGMHANELIQRCSEETSSFLRDAWLQFRALSSGVFTCADMFESADQENVVKLAGVEWAFAAPGAQRPEEAPSHLGATIADQFGQSGQGQAPPPREGEQVIGKHTADGITYTTSLRADGSTVQRSANGNIEHAFGPNGRPLYSREVTGGAEVVRSFDERGAVISTETTETTHDQQKHPREGVSSIDRETTAVTNESSGNESTTFQHKDTTTYPDGTQTRDYYTKNDKGEITSHQHIGRQPEKIDPEDWSKQAQHQLDQTRQDAGM